MNRDNNNVPHAAPGGGQNLSALTNVTFDGAALRVVEVNGRPAFLAYEVGAALGYAQARILVDNITGRWSDDFLPGQDFEILTRLEPSSDLLEGLSPHASTATVLYESGVYLACIKASTEAGRRLRRFIAAEVMPRLARGQAVGALDQIRRLPPAMQFLPALALAELLEAEHRMGETLPGLRAALTPKSRATRRELPAPSDEVAQVVNALVAAAQAGPHRAARGELCVPVERAEEALAGLGMTLAAGKRALEAWGFLRRGPGRGNPQVVIDGQRVRCLVLKVEAA